jgi:uncharacterized protein involved in exopolysaccharide biosynthesis
MKNEASDYLEDYPPLSQLPPAAQLDIWQQPRAVPSGVAEKQFSLLDVVEAWYRHKRLFFRVVLCVLALTLLVTIITPQSFESRMKILVQNARPIDPISPDRAERIINSGEVTEEQTNSEVELISSRDLLESVVKKVSRPSSVNTPMKLEKSVDSLQKALRVSPIRKSNVIEVQYTARTPEQARKVLDAISADYLDKHLHMQRPSGAYEFFKNEAERYRRDLEQAQSELSGLQGSMKVVSLEDQKTALQKQIDTAEQEIRISDANVHDIDQRMKTNSQLLKTITPRIATETRILPNQQAAETMNTLLVELRNRRTTMLTKFKPDDRLVKELDQQIAQTEEALKNATASSATEKTSDVNKTWQELRSQLATDQISRNGNMARRNALAAQLDESQKSLAELQADTVQYDAIARRVQELEANYKTYAQKRDEAQIADAMDQHKLLNVSIAEPPTLSLIPVRPRPLLNLVLGLFTAIFLGACAVFFAEMMRDTAYTPKELEAFTSLPVLASIPVQAFPGRMIGGSRRLAGERGKYAPGVLTAGRNGRWRAEASAD